MTESDESATSRDRRRIAATVGRILREAREQKNVGLRALARQIGHSNSTLSDWERGHSFAHEEVVKEYELALGLPHESLVQRVRVTLGPDWDDSFSRTRSRSWISDFGSSPNVWGVDIYGLYGRVLNQVTYHEPGNFTEITRYIYLIAEDDHDVVVEEHETTASGPELMRWRHFDPGSEPDSGAVRSFADLELKVWCEGPWQIEVLPLSVMGQSVKLVAFFLPPVDDQTIRWYVKYVWPGLWNPLRADGQDKGRLGFRPFTTRGEVVLVPPGPEKSLTFTSRDPKVGDVGDKRWNKDGVTLPGIYWGMDDPGGSYLSFTVSMQERKDLRA